MTPGGGYIYRAIFEIADLDRPTHELAAEACGLIDAMAAADGSRILGDVTWMVTGSRLVAEAPGAPLPIRHGRHGWVAAEATWIRSLAGRGLTDARIADLVGCSESAVAKVRGAARPPIPPGVGNPTITGVQQRRRIRTAADAV